MKLLYPDRHKVCGNYDNRENPSVEKVTIKEGEEVRLSAEANKILYFMKGGLRITANDIEEYEGQKGQIVFVPAGKAYLYKAMTDTKIMILRLDKTFFLCENFKLENLYQFIEERNNYSPRFGKRGSVLDISPPLQNLLNDLDERLEEGIMCRKYFDLKIKELLFLLVFYYTKEDLHDFFYLILSKDTVFSEYVRLRWQKFRHVKDLAASMHMTHRQFYNRFVAVFGKTPQKWILASMANIISDEIRTTDKPFKQIAIENNFNSEAQFTRFCKKQLGKTPTEIRNNVVPKSVKIDKRTTRNGK